MQKQTESNWRKQLVFLAIAAVTLIFAENLTVAAQGKYKSGDRVECNTVGSTLAKYEKFYEKGVVLAFRDGDQPDGSWYRVKADSNGVEYYCKIEHIRLIIAGKTDKPENKAAETNKEEMRKEQTETPAADGDFIECPVEQKTVKNGARPDAELVKKIIRCHKGEKSVEAGDEGAVIVEISAVQISASRPWSYAQDLGNAKPGTVVYPVKATYTVKTLYRAATEVEENWTRILNFYVNAFGEWQIGSEEAIKSPKVKRIPK